MRPLLIFTNTNVTRIRFNCQFVTFQTINLRLLSADIRDIMMYDICDHKVFFFHRPQQFSIYYSRKIVSNGDWKRLIEYFIFLIKACQSIITRQTFWMEVTKRLDYVFIAGKSLRFPSDICILLFNSSRNAIDGL